MRLRRLVGGVAALLAAPALAQPEFASLDGVGRVSVEAGWRLSANELFYESFYALPDSQGLARAPSSPGGPFLAASFGYSITEYLELGVDLFATGERLRLTNAPTLTNISYGALVALRFQTLLDVLTPDGVVPFIGLGTGPTLAYSQAEGLGKRELATQTFAGSVGATFRFSPQWALTAEYRIAFARGQSAYNNRDAFKSVLASYNAGGNWMALGVTYYMPPTDTRHPLP